MMKEQKPVSCKCSDCRTERNTKKRRHYRRFFRGLIMAGLVCCLLVMLACAGYFFLQYRGRSSLNQRARETGNVELTLQLNDPVLPEKNKVLELQEGQILVEGEVYQYNEEILTFLCMGIDSRSGIIQEKIPGEAGQADVLMLLIVNPQKKEVDMVTINRDTMINVEVYDRDGIYLGEEKGQITLQYAYGNGREKSCELMEKAVSTLFFGIPIHGYVAMDMKSIPTLNDAVGGVEVTILDDMTDDKKNWKKGEKVLLSGEDALYYIRQREVEVKETGSNIRRIQRQKQYLGLYVDKLKQRVSEDITFALSLLGELGKHLVTSLTVEEVAYLSGSLLNYHFSGDHMLSIPGESVMGVNEEFYADDRAIKQLVVKLFYEKVE